jgi:hypothetical protein
VALRVVIPSADRPWIIPTLCDNKGNLLPNSYQYLTQ